VSPLEQLFHLEVEFHRRLRMLAPGDADQASLHTSYAIQSGYDELIRTVGPVTSLDIETLRERLALAADARDLLKARDSLKKCLGIRLLDL